jgi:hypothetical protein
MTSIDIFYQGEGIREIAHFEADPAHSFAVIRLALIEKHGLREETLIYLEDRDEPIDENCLVRDHAGHAGIKANAPAHPARLAASGADLARRTERRTGRGPPCRGSQRRDDCPHQLT